MPWYNRVSLGVIGITLILGGVYGLVSRSHPIGLLAIVLGVWGIFEGVRPGAN